MAQMTHTLLHPIVVEKKNPSTGEIDREELKPAGHVVTLRRPKAKDLKAFDRHDDAAIAAIIDLIVSCTDLTSIEAENLDADDFGELGNLLEPRGRSSRPTGAPA